MNKRSLWLAIASAAIATGAGLWLRESAGVPREAAFMTGIFTLAALLWISEAIPLFATSLLVIGLETIFLANPGGWPGLGFENGKSPAYKLFYSAAADPVLVLFFGGFVLAQAAVREGVDRAVSSMLLKPFGSKPRWALLGIMSVTFVFGMWMSNTAITAIMLALAGPMLAALPPGDPFKKAVVLAIPFSANISGITTPIGSPPNAVAVGALHELGHSISFLAWMEVTAPLAILLMGLNWLLLWRFFKPKSGEIVIVHAAEPLTPRGKIVTWVFGITVLLWMTDQWHKLPASVVALFPAVAFTTTGLFSARDLGRLEWSVLILIAGGIALGAGIQVTGLGEIFVKALPLSGASAGWLYAVLIFATMALTTFISNTAAANLILPLALSSAAALGGGEGLHPVQAAIGVAVASSMSMLLPISTPPNALAHATGGIETRDMVKAGAILCLVAAAALILGSNWIFKMCGLI